MGSSQEIRGDYDVEEIWRTGSYENNLVGDLLDPFAAGELRELTEGSPTNSRRITDLILRAAAERDPSFGYLLNRADLREDEVTDLALCAYDYAVNGNPDALERVLLLHEKEAAESGGWDTNAIRVLGFIDEWDLTKRALERHSLSGDGAGGDARYAFWLRRRYLYPRNSQFPTNYQDFSDDLAIMQRQSEQERAGNR